MSAPTRYVALLRGINVGGNKKVPMETLKKALEKAGYKNVVTVLASGNVSFDGEAMKRADLEKKLETLLEKTFGFPIPVLIRTAAELKTLQTSAPFKGIKVDDDTRLYVTFLKTKPVSKMKSYESPLKDYRILRVTNEEICSVLQISPKTDTTKVMLVLEKEFGKAVTTRNWNTVEKLLK